MISYHFYSETRHDVKMIIIPFLDYKAKAVLKKFRQKAKKVNNVYGSPEIREGISNAVTDKDMVNTIANGKVLIAQPRTDRFYLLSGITQDESGRILKIEITYKNPERWSKK